MDHSDSEKELDSLFLQNPMDISDYFETFSADNGTFSGLCRLLPIFVFI